MAEFPGFGRHCSFPDCHRLDFLPIRCDACNKDFCTDHYSYSAHSCDKSKKRDVQVPVCPLCRKVVPVARGQLPDGPMNEHIETGCQSSRGQIYKFRCSVKGCKKRELVQMKCDKCCNNFCVFHRLPVDHKCTNGSPSSLSSER
uniref:AN1-type domain-containing protein n=1 Tax=Syphacia muris TaxID=451379 RepID=A0A0N5AE34_9BILA